MIASIAWKLPAEEKVVRFVLMAMFVVAAASILLTRQTGVDYLYYYLPIADYLFSRGMPTTVSQSTSGMEAGRLTVRTWMIGWWMR